MGIENFKIENWDILLGGAAIVAIFVVRNWLRRKYFLQDREANLQLSDSAQLSILRVESVRLFDRVVDAEQTVRTAVGFIEENPELAEAMLMKFLEKKTLPDPQRLLPQPLQPPLMVFGETDGEDDVGIIDIIKAVFLPTRK